jgi:hypothetical protein
MTNTPPVVDRLRQQLAAELGSDVATIRIVSVEEVEWPDSSLGHPQPGMMYMQVITPGYRVVFEYAGRQAVYHTDRGQQAVRVQ